MAKRLACVQPPLPSIFLRGGAAVHRLQKDPITLRLAILAEVEETQNAHNQAPVIDPCSFKQRYTSDYKSPPQI